MDLPPVTELLESKAARFSRCRVGFGVAAEQSLSLMYTRGIKQRSCLPASDVRDAFALYH